MREIKTALEIILPSVTIGLVVYFLLTCIGGI